MKSTTPMSFLTDVALAFVLLTRWPLPHLPQEAFARGARAVWAYPLVGAAVGTLATIIAHLALFAGIPAVMAAGLALVGLIMSTGAMHEDGLADTADGFWGGQTIAERLAIMKDSQIGTYGTVALVLSLGLRWSALTLLITTVPAALIASATLSRSAMPLTMHVLPPARENGLAHSVGRPSVGPVVIGLALAAAIAVACIGILAVAMLVAVLLATFVLMRAARIKIGGHTGDILGATQQLSEIAALLVLVTVLT